MNRTEITDTILKDGVTAGFEVVATGGDRRNPVFWRKPTGEIVWVFNIQARDFAKDTSHLEAAVKRFKGFAEAEHRVIVLHEHHYDGTEKPDGTAAVLNWLKSNVKGNDQKIEVWNEMTRVG